MTLTVPDTLAEVLDPAWLSDALGQRFPGHHGARPSTGTDRVAGVHQRALPHQLRGRRAPGRSHRSCA